MKTHEYLRAKFYCWIYLCKFC